MSKDCHDSRNRSVETENRPTMTADEQRILYATYLGRFLGATPNNQEERAFLGDKFIVNRMMELARDFTRAEQDIPGALIQTEGQTVRGHQEGHEAGK